MKTLVLLLSVAAVGCGAAPEVQPEGAASNPLAVTVGLVSMTDGASTFDAGGVLVARQTAVVSSRVLAPITRVRVNAGDQVRRGQTLIELDGAEIAAQATRARAGVESARAGAAVAASARAAADAGLTLAKATHARMAKLHEARSATTQELDEAVAGLRRAEAQVAMAAAQADAAAKGVEAAQAAAGAADIAQSWSTLTAPFDGLVSARHVDPGTTAAPGQPLLTIEATGDLQLDVSLDASRAATLAVGQAVTVRIDGSADSDAWVAGQISEIARVDPLSHAFVVTVDVEKSPTWRSGLFGRARFTGAAEQRLSVPASAVITRGQLTFVYVVGADDRARLRAVSLGETGTSVLAGLNDGDRVVLNPDGRLTDGAAVRATAATTPEGVR